MDFTQSRGLPALWPADSRFENRRPGIHYFDSDDPFGHCLLHQFSQRPLIENLRAPRYPSANLAICYARGGPGRPRATPKFDGWSACHERKIPHGLNQRDPPVVLHCATPRLEFGRIHLFPNNRIGFRIRSRSPSFVHLVMRISGIYSGRWAAFPKLLRRPTEFGRSAVAHNYFRNRPGRNDSYLPAWID